ncbi:Uncharacterized protein TCAP_03855 [Tolypocladium capitatum]|uniref:Aminoglycoside phosphotransferase domain-containing protein n=1 Tax=Tolypocladium capitatum TaxID=45235 RepID=A0A2K3QFC2_9HYPO|nr:Uncharacterized protein TCAP_03855 [Tolypocladium capitatum]
MDSAILPDISLSEVDFHETSFFQTPTSTSPIPQLPTPPEVLSARQYTYQYVIKFEDRNLVVKFGRPPAVDLEEALALRAAKHAFPNNEVHVPELYGWRVLDGQNFIYMSRISGSTLQDASQSLSYLRREGVNLGPACSSFTRVKPFLGFLSRNDLLSHTEISFQIHATSTFTHGDLNRGNIIISGTPGLRKIVGIVDWEQAGRYPDYWEYCKALIAEPYDEEWRAAHWVEIAVQCYDDEWTAFSEYWSWRCP